MFCVSESLCVAGMGVVRCSDMVKVHGEELAFNCQAPNELYRSHHCLVGVCCGVTLGQEI